jgi:hypothetical protein
MVALATLYISSVTLASAFLATGFVMAHVIVREAKMRSAIAPNAELTNLHATMANASPAGLCATGSETARTVRMKGRIALLVTDFSARMGTVFVIITYVMVGLTVPMMRLIVHFHAMGSCVMMDSAYARPGFVMDTLNAMMALMKLTAQRRRYKPFLPEGNP